MTRPMLLGGAAAVAMLLSNAGPAAAAAPRVLQESEWPASVVMDIHDPVSNCAQEGGTLSHPDRAHYICFISSKDCAQKGWQIIERDAVINATARVQACHKKSAG